MKPTRLTLAQLVCRWLPPVLGGRVRSIVYPQHMARADGYAFVVRSRTGSPFKGEVSDFFAYPFSVQGYYNWRNWACALGVCSPGDTIIEVGANVGTETIGFSDIVGCEGSVYAFEPYPPNIERLRDGISLSRCDNVTIMPVALSDRPGTLQFNRPKDDNSGIGHVAYSGGQARSDAIEVVCETLDALMGRLGPVQFICMDAEGSEVFILRGARRYLDAYRPAFIVEADPRNNLKRHGFTLHDLYNEITELDYTVFDMGWFGLQPPDLEAAKGMDWFCLHKAHLEQADKVHRTLRRAAVMPFLWGLNPLDLR